jgi:hypothetical protein
LTLKALSLCCAKPLTVTPATTTATANENLIFFQSPARKATPDELPVASYLSLDARTLPSQGSYPSSLNPPPPEITRANRNKGNGLTGATVRATPPTIRGGCGTCKILHIAGEFPCFHRQKLPTFDPAKPLITLHKPLHAHHRSVKAASDWAAAWCIPASAPTRQVGSPPSHPRSVRRARSWSGPPS